MILFPLFVTNLSNLNSFIAYHHFKMDILLMILTLMRENNCNMALMDLQDAYYSIPIALTDRNKST